VGWRVGPAGLGFPGLDGKARPVGKRERGEESWVGLGWFGKKGREGKGLFCLFFFKL